MDRFLYLFLDEAGNFDFSPGGTKYFVLSAVSKERPFRAYQEMTELKYDKIEAGASIEYFHASEDSQNIRNHVFDIIRRNLANIRIDSIIVEKRKIGPALRPEEHFYPRMLGYLIKYIINGYQLDRYKEVIVFTDQIPVRKKRNAIEKAAKTTLSELLPQSVRYRVLHHDSKSNMDLQIIDYCNWAIYRKWDAGDERSYQIIKPAVSSEFDFCRTGTTFYY